MFYFVTNHVALRQKYPELIDKMISTRKKISHRQWGFRVSTISRFKVLNKIKAYSLIDKNINLFLTIFGKQPVYLLEHLGIYYIFAQRSRTRNPRRNKLK